MQIFRPQTFSLSLQSGILGGALVLTSTTAFITIVVHRDDIFVPLGEKIGKSKELFKNHIYPIFTYYSKSIDSLFKDLKEGYEHLSSKLEVVKKSLYLDGFSESFKEMFVTISNWTYATFDFIKDKGSYLVSNENHIRQFIVQAYRILENFSGFLSLLLSFLEVALRNRENIPSLAENTVNLFKENMVAIGFMDREKYRELFENISNDPEYFKRRIKNLSDSSSKWGKYGSWEEMKKELFPSEAEKKTMKLIEKVTKGFIECKKDDVDKNTCWQKFVEIEEIKAFKKLLKDERLKKKLEEALRKKNQKL